MSAPFAGNPPTSHQLTRSIDYTNKTGTLNQVIDALNAWLTTYKAPFPQIVRVNPRAGSRHGVWTNEVNRVITASNQFYDWGYGGGTIPLSLHKHIGFNLFTTAINRLVSYWALPYQAKPDQTLPPVNVDVPHMYGPHNPAQLKDMLTCTMGNWDHVPTAYAYQWFRLDVNTSAWKAIGSAKKSTYRVAKPDLNSFLFCRVTASNSAGAVSIDSNDIMTIGPTPHSGE